MLYVPSVYASFSSAGSKSFSNFFCFSLFSFAICLFSALRSFSRISLYSSDILSWAAVRDFGNR